MKEFQIKAFDFAAECTKLIITLSTGVIALTITFSKDFIGDKVNFPIWPLVTAWSCYFLSIILGLASLLSFTAVLHPQDLQIDKLSIENHEQTVSINHSNTRRLVLLQIMFFLVAILFTGIFGFTSLSAKSNNVQACLKN